MKIYILRTIELLDVLPFSTLYGIYGILLYMWIAVFYPAYLTYRLTRRAGTKNHGLKEHVKKPLSKRERFAYWLKKKANTVVFTLYGETNENLTSFLTERDTSFEGKDSADIWKQTQLFWLGLMIRLNALSLLLLSALALWDRFLIQRSTECNDEKICFIGTNDAIHDWERTPISNCSNVTDTTRVVCFEFTYSIGDAVGLAGGLITYGVYTMKFGSIVIISTFSQLKKCCNRTTYRVLAIVVQQLPITIMLIAAAFSIAFVRVRDLVFYGTFVEAFGVASVLALVLATPWGVLVPEPKRKHSTEKDESGKRDKTTNGEQQNGGLDDFGAPKVDHLSQEVEQAGVEIVLSETESMD